MMPWNSPTNQKRLKRLFEEGSSVMDIAEPLVSFDAEQPAMVVQNFLEEKAFDVGGVRRHGIVCGYACREELGDGSLGGYLHGFTPEDLVMETDSLQGVIRSMSA